MRRTCFFTVWKLVSRPPSQRSVMYIAPQRSASACTMPASCALGADEEDVLAAQDDVARELLRELELPQRLLEIDDVDPVALGEDEAAHLGIPAAGLVSEVDAGREELLERWAVVMRVCHVDLRLVLSSAVRHRRDRPVVPAPDRDSERVRDSRLRRGRSRRRACLRSA